MYAVRENRTSILRTSRGPMPHALEHVSRLGGSTTHRLSGGQAPSSCTGSHQDSEIPKTSVRTLSSSTELRHQSSVNAQSAVIESHFAAELANRDLVIGELQSMLIESKLLQGKLLQSENLASRQALQLASQDVTIDGLRSKLSQSKHKASKQALLLSDMRLAQKDKDTRCNEMLSSLEKAYTKVHQSTVKAEGALTIIKKHKEQLAQADEELQEQLQVDQQWLNIKEDTIQGLEENLKLSEETVVGLQKQLKDTTVQMEVQAQAEVRMQQELEQHQNTIADLRNQHEAACTKIEELHSNLAEQLQSSQDLLEKYREKEQSEHELRRALAKKDVLLNEVAQELSTRDGQVQFFCKTLKKEQMKGLSKEHSLKLVQEQSERFSFMRCDLEQRNSALEKEIIRLKHEVRKYAEIIVGNEGDPFFEVRHTESPSVDAPAELPIPKSQDAVIETVGQESNPRSNTYRTRVIGPMPQP